LAHQRTARNDLDAGSPQRYRTNDLRAITNITDVAYSYPYPAIRTLGLWNTSRVV
jgi:hypothetical protein